MREGKISICTVVMKTTDWLMDVYVKSIVQRTSFVDEVLLAKIDAEEGFYEEKLVDGITFKTFAARNYMKYDLRNHRLQHPCGLREAIQRAKNEYVWMMDPDIFFYDHVDRFFLSLIEKYKLDYIGFSHPAATCQAYVYFPSVFCSLCKKADLPDEHWLAGLLESRFGILANDTPGYREDCRGEYLISGAIPGLFEKFPNKEGRFDTGVNLYLWHLEKNWKWLSFQTTDARIFSTKYCKSNFQNLKFKDKLLLFHLSGGALLSPPEDIWYNNWEASNELHGNRN